MNVPLPSDKIVVDDFSQILSGLFPFFLICVFIGPVYITVYNMVQEKELRSKESMRMMGMSDLSYWLSWFCFYALQVTVVTLVSWGCLMINVISDGSAGYVFLYIWVFGLCVFGQVVLFQSLFSRAKYSGLIGVLIFVMCYYAELPLANSTSASAKGMASLIPQVAISQMAIIWADFEENQLGLNHDSVRQNIQGYTFMQGIWMLVLDFFLWAILGFYCDAVLPKQYGTKSHPCFCFMPKSYRGCCKGSGNNDDPEEEERRSTLLKKDHEEGESMELKYLDRKNYEPVPVEVARQGLDGDYLRIEDLEKVYENGFHAVKGLNVKIY